MNKPIQQLPDREVSKSNKNTKTQKQKINKSPKTDLVEIAFSTHTHTHTHSIQNRNRLLVGKFMVECRYIDCQLQNTGFNQFFS